MNPSAARPRSPLISSPLVRAELAVILAALAAYYNCFGGLFLFDDTGAIMLNPTIRHLWPIWDCLSPPTDGTPVTGRPLVNLSFAINRAVAGDAAPWSYHLVNLVIHVCAALTLFGLVRRTLLLGRVPARLRSHALLLATSVAALWVVHPLTTEAVTYISQRAEALFSLFYLLTFYCFVRGATEGSAGWLRLAVAACLAGMASKEIMFSAPMLVLLFDRTFLAGTFGEAWRKRRLFYAALAATWLLLAYEMAHAGSRGGSVGVGVSERFPVWNYFLTQCGGLVHYLWLVIWPHPLVFDYGLGLVSGFREVAPQFVVMVLLGVATMVGLWRNSPLGFLGAWFFGILAPTSSFIPATQQSLAEHRMYLPLAAVLIVLVVALELVAGKHMPVLVILWVTVLSMVTMFRNNDYADGVKLWGDSLALHPDHSARARNNYGNALVQERRFDDALAQYDLALVANPTLAEAYNNRAAVEAYRGQILQAMHDYQEALRVQPKFGRALDNLRALEAAHPEIVPPAQPTP